MEDPIVLISLHSKPPVPVGIELVHTTYLAKDQSLFSCSIIKPDGKGTNSFIKERKPR